MILAGDIGGTKCKLALFEEGARASGLRVPRPRLVAQARFTSGDFASLEDIVSAFLCAHPGKVTAASFGIAGPVIGTKVKATNLPWLVDGEVLSRLLGIPHTILLNDLEATAHSLPLLEPSELCTLNRGTPAPEANLALIAAGTGLGEAIIFRRDGRTFVSPGEGGHTDFAPRTDEEIELLRHLRKTRGRVSWEDVLSGKGFRAIHEFLAPDARHPSFDDPAADPAPEITQLGFAAKCPACVRTLDMWATLYGAEAGNLAMKALARGGVYVAGGIAVKLLDKLKEGKFVEAFCDKSKFSTLLRQFPIHVVLNEDAPVLGAAAARCSAD